MKSRCNYGLFFASMGKEAVEAIEVIDAAFISVTLFPVGAGDKGKLEKLRTLLCIEFPRYSDRSRHTGLRLERCRLQST